MGDGNDGVKQGDVAGRGLVSRANGAGGTLRFTRDTLGRVVEQRDDTGDVTTYAYGPEGGLVRATGACTEVVLERDALGRVLSETVDDRTTRFGYDPLRRRTAG